MITGRVTAGSELARVMVPATAKRISVVIPGVLASAVAIAARSEPGPASCRLRTCTDRAGATATAARPGGWAGARAPAAAGPIEASRTTEAAGSSEATRISEAPAAPAAPRAAAAREAAAVFRAAAIRDRAFSSNAIPPLARFPGGSRETHAWQGLLQQPDIMARSGGYAPVTRVI